MSINHPNFPLGKGIWIWKISECEGGDIDKIIKRLKDNDFKYALVKAGDGERTWAQFNVDLIKRFHDAGLKIYSWTYNYGINPLREAAIAIWALDMGADGHVFDAEGEYERLANPADTAKTMLIKVRDAKPNAFLAHAPFPIIDYHTKFPYIEFGRYCDAVMPQMYWGTMNRTPANVVSWTFKQWTKWEAIWKNNGNEKSIKPIIPIGQTYDNATVGYKSNPADLKSFIELVRGYKSINFWSYQHISRNEDWDAIKNTRIDTVTATETPQPVGESVPPPVPSTPKPTLPATEEPVEVVEVTTVDANGDEVPVVDIAIDVENPSASDNTPTGEILLPPELQKVEDPTKQEHNTELPSAVVVPVDIKTTIELVPNENCAHGIEVKVKYDKTHLDILISVVSYILQLLKLKRGVNK